MNKPTQTDVVSFWCSFIATIAWGGNITWLINDLLQNIVMVLDHLPYGPNTSGFPALAVIQMWFKHPRALLDATLYNVLGNSTWMICYIISWTLFLISFAWLLWITKKITKAEKAH